MAGGAKWILLVGIVVGVGAIIMSAGKASATEVWKGSKAIKASASKFTRSLIASAKQWAEKRSIPAIDVLATILLESGGNPKAHALSSKEDSRGLMQVNVRAWGSLLTKLGYSQDDLYKPEIGIELGTYVLADARAKVQKLVNASKVKQYHDVSTLTRLYYAGPKYVDTMLRKAATTEQTKSPFKASDLYVQHWKDAIKAVSAYV
jgi:soluble lytic murein transglycosylase-like protein